MAVLNLLVLNAGSSSLKLSVIAVADDEFTTITSRSVERWSGAEETGPLRDFLTGPAGDIRIDAVVHRVVHGGRDLVHATVIDDAVLATIDGLTSLAPLHQPRALAGISAAGIACPGVPQIACFDTGFHADLPVAAATYALPREWNERFGLRRFGFHGLSHSWAVRRGAELVGAQRVGAQSADLRIVSAHLGSGASLAAVVAGRSVDTTMGMTPLEGLVMGTRAGSVDPGLLMWLLRAGGLTPGELESGLEHDSGLAGLSGTSGDMRDVLEAGSTGNEDAALAYGVFRHRLRREAGAMVASAGGLDVLVITGGIGENTPIVRADLASGLEHLGVVLDHATNEAARGDAVISSVGHQPAVVVVSAREEYEMARQAAGILNQQWDSADPDGSGH